MTYTKKIPAFPPEISAHRRALRGGVLYEFFHERLGPIGRLALFTQGPSQTQVTVDVVPGDPDESLWEERFKQLEIVARACLAPFGVGVPLAGIEEAKATARLYQQFSQISNHLQMWDFARDLSEEDYMRLLSLAMLSRRAASPAEALDLQQRLSLLRQARQADSQEWP
jgi:hypothetical protein